MSLAPNRRRAALQPPSRSRGALVSSLPLLALLGCLPDITLTPCERNSDCDAASGYCSCQEGYCFRGGCGAVAPALLACVGAQQSSCCRFDAGDPDCAPNDPPLVTGPSSPAARSGDLSALAAHNAAGAELLIVDARGQLLARAPLADLPPGHAGWPVVAGERRWLVATPAPTQVTLQGLGAAQAQSVVLDPPEAGRLASNLAVWPGGTAVGLSDKGRLWRFPDGAAAAASATPLTAGEGAEVLTYAADVTVLHQAGRLLALDASGAVLLDAAEVGSAPVADQQLRPSGPAILASGEGTALQVFRPIGSAWAREAIDVKVHTSDLVLHGRDTLLGLVPGTSPAVVGINLDATPPTVTWTLPLTGTAGSTPLGLCVFGADSWALYTEGEGLALYRLGETAARSTLQVAGAFGATPTPLDDGTLLWLGGDGRLRRMLGDAQPVSHDWPYAGGGPGLTHWLGGDAK